jgi:hypothetical protein
MKPPMVRTEEIVLKNSVEAISCCAVVDNAPQCSEDPSKIPRKRHKQRLRSNDDILACKLRMTVMLRRSRLNCLTTLLALQRDIGIYSQLATEQEEIKSQTVLLAAQIANPN